MLSMMLGCSVAAITEGSYRSRYGDRYGEGGGDRRDKPPRKTYDLLSGRSRKVDEFSITILSLIRAKGPKSSLLGYHVTYDVSKYCFSPLCV